MLPTHKIVIKDKQLSRLLKKHPGDVSEQAIEALKQMAKTVRVAHKSVIELDKALKALASKSEQYAAHVEV